MRAQTINNHEVANIAKYNHVLFLGTGTFELHENDDVGDADAGHGGEGGPRDLKISTSGHGSLLFDIL